MVDPKRLEPGSVTEAILWIRGMRVILDDTLASLYGVPTKSLIETGEEFAILRYQFGTSSSWGGRRHQPYAFTEHGVAMLSSVLRSLRRSSGDTTASSAWCSMRSAH
jgi:hypothetical protein